MFRKQIALAAGAIGLMAAALPATAASQQSPPGVAQPGVVTCRASTMSVAAPNIEPNRDTGIVGGYQVTGFVSILKRWDATRRAWVPVRRSPSYFTRSDGLVIPPEVFSYFDPVYQVWRDVTQGPTFSMVGRRGYFTVSFEFYWLDNVNGQGTNRVIARKLTGAWEVFDERRYPFRNDLKYCLYR
jgi:hypothetical protein